VWYLDTSNTYDFYYFSFLLTFGFIYYSLPADNSYATQNKMMSFSSQRFATTASGGSQMTPEDHFIQGHRILKLSDIIKLPKVDFHLFFSLFKRIIHIISYTFIYICIRPKFYLTNAG
jgi:hypothetical protein